MKDPKIHYIICPCCDGCVQALSITHSCTISYAKSTIALVGLNLNQSPEISIFPEEEPLEAVTTADVNLELLAVRGIPILDLTEAAGALAYHPDDYHMWSPPPLAM